MAAIATTRLRLRLRRDADPGEAAAGSASAWRRPAAAEEDERKAAGLLLTPHMAGACRAASDILAGRGPGAKAERGKLVTERESNDILRGLLESWFVSQTSLLERI